MIAFFLTMPISRMMPMTRDQARDPAGHEQREQRADAGRRQRRENRDRVDVALVEHAEHDVHRDDGGEDQQRVCRARPERLRRALEASSGCSPASRLALRRLDGRDGLAERRAGREVERHASLPGTGRRG